jgi:hypothetical protein
MVCEECGREAEGGAFGWRGYRIDDPEEGEPPQIAFWCLVCAVNEFGPLRSRVRDDD